MSKETERFPGATLSPRAQGKQTVFEEYLCLRTGDGHDFVFPLTMLAGESKRIRQMLMRDATRVNIVSIAPADRKIEAEEPG